MSGLAGPRWRQAWGGLPRVLALGFLVLVLISGQPTPTQAAGTRSPAAAGFDPGSPVVELLRLGVPAANYRAWLRAEQASWEPWLAKQPGFQGRQLLWDRQHQEATLLISWASRAQWKAIPEADVARVQGHFEQLARQLTGVTSGNPFPLLAEAELEPPGSLASQPPAPGLGEPALAG